MPHRVDEVRLQNGTMIRHKVVGYEGRIDGTTEIRSCFTARGELLVKSSAGQAFQYRVAVTGESMRRIAPAEDLEVLDAPAIVACPSCHASFQSKPGATGKPGGRCRCGEWICPICLACQATSRGSDQDDASCLHQRKRLVGKFAARKKRLTG